MGHPLYCLPALPRMHRASPTVAVPVLVGLFLLAACSSTYYDAMEKLGYAKRDLLVERVAKTEEAQKQAKEQFASALDHFLAVTKVDGGELERRYKELDGELKRSEDRAKAVRDRIAAVQDVANALFREWKGELGQYTNSELRSQSERELEDTERPRSPERPGRRLQNMAPYQ